MRSIQLEEVHPGEWRFVVATAPDELLAPAAHARVVAARPLWLRAAWWTSEAWVTIGTTIYPPRRAVWPGASVSTLAHELIHVRQWLDLGPLLWIVYLLGVPLPLGLAWGRYCIEREAYSYEIRHHGASPEACARAVSSSLYGWAWPRSWALAYFRRVAAK